MAAPVRPSPPCNSVRGVTAMPQRKQLPKWGPSAKAHTQSRRTVFNRECGLVPRPTLNHVRSYRVSGLVHWPTPELAAPWIRRTAYGMSPDDDRPYSGLMPANLITLAHFSISSEISLP